MIIGIKRNKDMDTPLYEAWVRTEDYDDMALPADEIIATTDGEAAMAALTSRHPCPAKTYRIRQVHVAGCDVRAYRHPVLDDAVTRKFDRRRYGAYDDVDREAAARTIAEVVEACGMVLVMDDWEDVRRWRKISDHEIEAVEFEEHAAFVPVTPLTMARRAAARKGVLTKEKNEQAYRERERQADEARRAAVDPVVEAFTTLQENLLGHIKGEFAKRELPWPYPVDGRLTIGELVRWYDYFTKRSYRKLPDHVALMRAIDAAGRHRQAAISNVGYLGGWGTDEYAAWCEARSKRRRRAKALETAEA